MPHPDSINPRTGKRYNFVDPELELRQAKNTIAALKRQERALQCRDDLLAFTKFTMPDPEAMNDIDRTRYEAARFHTEVAKVLEQVERGEITQLIFCMPPRHGKRIADDEVVPTPKGFVRHGDLKPGDYVFGPDGRPALVEAVEAPANGLVPVTFSNGAVVHCDLGHLWTVFDRAAGKWRILTTGQMAKRALRVGPAGRGGRYVLQVPDIAALQYPTRNLPLDPYVFGAWLGDGTANVPKIAHDPRDTEVVRAFETAGYPVNKAWVQKETGVGYADFWKTGLQDALRQTGALQHKHIPELYLRSGLDQRLDLLAGLIDTDGHVDQKSGRVRFSTCSEEMRDGVFDLAAGLGFRPYIVAVEPTRSSSGVIGKKTVYQVGFQPNRSIPTRIPRKKIERFAARRRISVVSVGAERDGMARCIKVARADGLYLVGRHLIPTHNTELATKRFAAWYSGRHPEHDIIAAAAGDDLAHDFGADVRAIMQMPQFKQVFPNHKLRRGGTAKDNIVTDKGGRLIFAGRGGQINGRGAHCFPGETTVETPQGSRRIDQVKPGDEVLSYDFLQRRIVWRKVQAVAVRPPSRLFRITTADGRMVEATGDHRFFSEGDWTEARKLTPGSGLLCSLRQDRGEEGVRDREAREAGSRAFLLLQRLLGRGGERTSLWSTALRALRRAGAETQRVVRGASARAHLLLKEVPGRRARGGTGAAAYRAHETLRAVSRHVCAAEQRVGFLQPELCIAGARGEDGGRGQPTLEERSLRFQGQAACDAEIPRTPSACDATGRDALRSVRCGTVERQASELGSSPHRRGCVEQPREQFGDSLPGVPRAGAFFARTRDFVREIEETCRYADVYDIQVEETECFFANGILAHNCLLIDDLYKDAEEARSQTIRDKAWEWLNKVAFYRRMGKRLTVITMTRWHSDDIVGRLTDPENPHYNAQEAASWKIIRLPGLAEEDDPLGRPEGEPLWPERFDKDYHLANQRRDPLGFAALTQQRPTVADGILFRRETIQFYTPDQLPDELRVYCASDHAVGEKQRNDPSCFIKVGVDRQNNIYILDVIWQRVATDAAVEMMLSMASGDRKPLLWWAERGHISKSIGPFLRKRMEETGTYINLVEVTPAVDKEQRAQSIAGRVAMGKVYFPKTSWWTERAINELLAFPNGNHDDFVDALAYIGLGLQHQFGPAANANRKPTPREGTLAWLKKNDAWVEARRKAAGGF